MLKLFEVYMSIANNIAFLRLSISLPGISAPILKPMFSDTAYMNGKPKNYSTPANNLMSVWCAQFIISS